jgi:2',3'-cyclic-nucleotide 2'-phosphodiesterase
VKLLYFGDVVGRAAREAVYAALPELKQRFGLDFIVVNGENAAGGFGITDKICKEFYAAGVDVITTGNHVWDQRETVGYIGSDPRLLRPANFPPQTPGAGAGVFAARNGKKVCVIQVMGRIFMDPLDCPFAAVDQALAKHRLGGSVDLILVDIHGEATSEKMAMGHFCDGRVSAVIGTHSHIPTADAQILPGGTAYQTDAGMCGDYNSVIGMDKEQPLQRFVRKIPTSKFEAAQGEPTLCAVYVETDDKTGLAKAVAPLRMGGRLAPIWPA